MEPRLNLEAGVERTLAFEAVGHGLNVRVRRRMSLRVQSVASVLDARSW
jgi:hypothetical protein